MKNNNQSKNLPDFDKFPTPAYVVDEARLIANLEVLRDFSLVSGCKVLAALKGFSMYHFFPLMGEYLEGITASSLNETRLGRREMNREVHTYAVAFVEEEFQAVMDLSDYLVFNSFAQWDKYKGTVAAYEKQNSRKLECGIRINPEYSEVETMIYNPCAPYSRLGTTLDNFRQDLLDGISGLHFHTLCEQNSDALLRTIPHVDEKFGPYISRMKWLNLGGGHHVTREDYDIEGLISAVKHFQDKYGVQVYIEPGEAIALNTGFLVSTVLDVVNNGMEIAILDTSAACHMPDVIEMPYRPEVIGAGLPGEGKFTYRLSGPTCLAGDIIGDYSFDKPLQAGDRVVFCDMAHYTMVKNNTFNGINLPAIAVWTKDGKAEILKEFGYEDYRRRL